MNNLQSLSYYWPELLLVTIILTAVIYDLLTKPSESQRVGLLVFAADRGLATKVGRYLHQITHFTSSWPP